MKKLLILLFLITTNQLSAQEGELIIVNTNSQKERVIKENKRIRITTISGEKFQGRYRIINKNVITLDGEVISLSDIARIKRHPLFNTIFIKSNLIHIGALGLFFGILFTGLSGSYGFLVGGAVILAGGIYGAIKSPNLNKGYHINKNWKFSIRTGINDEGQITNVVNQF
jgi:hypothetical protein